MADIWLYIPFPDLTNDPTVRMMANDLRQAGLRFRAVDDDAGGSFLAGVQDDDLLLLGAHGLANYNTIFIKGAAGMDALSADQLAGRITAAGLRKTHETLLLLTCSGGGRSVMKVDTEAMSVTPQMMTLDFGQYGRAGPVARSPYKCLASVLGKALGQRGYRSIQVGGFPGDLGQTEAGEYAFKAEDTDGQDRSVLAEMDHIQWFDASGHTTAETYERLSAHSRG